MEKMTRNLLSPSKEEDGDGRETYFPSLDGKGDGWRVWRVWRVRF